MSVSHFVRLPAAGLHYRVSGPEGAPWLVFSNSLGTDLRLWDGVLSRLGGRYRVLTYDKRGHGLSDAPPAPYTLDDHVGDLLALLDRVGVERAAVCGLSVGGMIAQGLAARAPERVTALVLSNTAARIGTVALWQERIEAIRRNGIESMADGVMERWFSARFRAEEEDLSKWRNMLVRTTLDGYLGTCEALAVGDLTETTRHIRVPTLVIGGAVDGSTPPDVVRGLADLVPGAKCTILDGLGHLPCVENPDLYARILEDFLKGAGHV